MESLLFKERSIVVAVLNAMGVCITIHNNEIFIEEIVTKVEQFPMKIRLYDGGH